MSDKTLIKDIYMELYELKNGSEIGGRVLYIQPKSANGDNYRGYRIAGPELDLSNQRYQVFKQTISEDQLNRLIEELQEYSDNFCKV